MLELMFYSYFVIPGFFALGFIVKDGSHHIYLPVSTKRESKKVVRGEMEEKFLLFSVHKPEIVYILSICIIWAEHSHTVIAAREIENVCSQNFCYSRKG